jgi:hypothetical protein
VTLLLLALACTRAPVETVDSDVPDDPDPQPLVDMRDRFWVQEGDLLPNQEADWCDDVSLSRFPDYEGCFGQVLSCRQGLWFEPDADAWRLYDLVAVSCDGTGAEEPHAPISAYGQWVFLDNAETGDLYRVNAMQWLIDPTGDGEVQLEAPPKAGDPRSARRRSGACRRPRPAARRCGLLPPRSGRASPPRTSGSIG